MSKFKEGDVVRFKRDVITDFRIPRFVVKQGTNAVITKVGPWGYTIRLDGPNEQIVYGKDLELVRREETLS